MSLALFLVGYVSVLTLPGLALTLSLNLRFNPVLSSIALSYICFTMLFLIANYFGLTYQVLQACVLTALIAASGYLLKYRSRLLLCCAKVSKPIVVITSLSVLYQLVIGPYSEVPADIYAHLERFQSALRIVERGSLGYSLGVKQLLMQGSGVYYYLLAGIAAPTQATGIDVINVVDFVNRTAFIIATYFFARFLFSARNNTTLIAALACVFVTLHMGINVFAYLRYYSLAPGMLNFVIYLFAVSAFMWATNKRATKPLLIVYSMITLAVIAAAAIHLQEAVFIAVTISLIALVHVIKVIPKLREPNQVDRNYIWHPAIVLLLATLIFAVLYISTYASLPRAPNAHWRLWGFGNAENILYVLNLKQEFIQVITLWGVLIYGLFIVNIKRYLQNPFILAGMLLTPILTFMNPLFVDLFLRHYNSTTLWRLSFLLPIHYVAADLTGHYLTQLRGYVDKMSPQPDIKSPQPLNKSLQLNQKLGAGLAIAGITALLFTPQNFLKGFSYNRLSTLLPKTSGVDHHHYADLIAFLNNLKDPKTYRTVLTDPMSGYMISGLTPLYSVRNKFFRGDRFIHFTFENYQDNPLDRYAGALLVVNLREKYASDIGALSSHWPEDEWVRIDRYYPPQLLEHLEARPQKFKQLWTNNGVTVYQVQP